MRFLEQRWGTLRPCLAVDPVEVPVGESRLSPAGATALTRALTDARVRTDRIARLRAAAGSSYDDLLRLRSGVDLCVPDVVVEPVNAAEVAAVLGIAEQHQLAVVAVGGGTSVVGGVEPAGAGAPVLVLDLARMAGLLRLQPVDRIATFGPGTTGPQAEALLAEHGLALGHVPQSWARATLGGYAATRSAGQVSTGWGRFDEMVVGARVTTPRGELVVGTGTPNAVGPDLRHLVLGSEGILGVITEVSVRVRRAPQVRRYEGWMLPSLEAGISVLRALAQNGVRADSLPDVARLSDRQETEIQLALRRPGLQSSAVDRYLRLRRRAAGCLLIVGWEGAEPGVRQRHREAARWLDRAGGVSLGAPAGEAWHRHRFDAPSQRDALLDAGILVETVETATTWSQVGPLRQAVRAALEAELAAPGAPPMVMTHLSHVYPTGACLYVTVLAPRVAGDVAAARDQWRTAKAAVTEAVLTHGGTLTHHHAVGRDHAPWLEREIGPLGVELIAAAKAAVDPAGVLNPGVLLR